MSTSRQSSHIQIMEDTKKIKPYIAHLNNQIRTLEPEIKKLAAKSLDEQLLSLKDEKEKLNLSNKYAYILSSLTFAYMKVLNVKDMSPVMAELERVKSYMGRAKQLEKKDVKEQQLNKEEQERAKKIINSVLDGRQSGPAISKVNFQGKHTKFEDKNETDDEREQSIDREKLVSKIKQSKKKPGKNEGGKVGKRKAK